MRKFTDKDKSELITQLRAVTEKLTGICVPESCFYGVAQSVGARTDKINRLGELTAKAYAEGYRLVEYSEVEKIRNMGIEIGTL